VTATFVEALKKLPLPVPSEAARPSSRAGISEDRLAVRIGVVVLSVGWLLGKDILGWSGTTSSGTRPRKAFVLASKNSARWMVLIAFATAVPGSENL
jgi:hypothetical protein